VLIRSMSRRIRRLPESFDETEPDGTDGPAGGPGRSGSDEPGDSSSAGTESSGRS
jgi:hypothetical protein